MNNSDLLKFLYPFAKPYYKRFIISFFLLPLGALAFSVQPFFVQKAIDGPLKVGDLNGLMPLVIGLVTAIVSHFVLQATQVWITNSTAQKIVADLRLKAFSHLESLPMTFFDNNPVGRTVTRITSDIEQLSESFAGGLILVITDMLNIVWVLAFMFSLSWQLTLVVLGLLLPMLFVARHFQRQYREANLNARKELSKLNSFLQQNIIGVTVVHMLNSLDKSMKIFADINKVYFEENNKTIKADAQFSASIELVSILVIALMIFVSHKIVVAGALSIGVIIAFLQYTQVLFDPVRNLSDRFTIIQAGFTAAERIKQLLDEPLEIHDPCPQRAKEVEDAYVVKPGQSLVEFDEVKFAYLEDELVLNKLNLNIKAGEKVALVGQTGCGKSTVIKLISRLYDISSGAIKFAGQSLSDYQQSFLRKQIATVHQDSYIFEATLAENVTLDRPGADLEAVKPLLKLLDRDINEQLNARGTNLSAGEKQVISFARALAVKPKLLVLDEATANIDVQTETAIYKVLKSSFSDLTMISIAHRLETILDSDVIFCLEKGQVKESGNHAELITQNGSYKDLYDLLV